MTDYITGLATLIAFLIITFSGCGIIGTVVIEGFKALDRWLSRRFGLCLLNWIQGE